MRRNRHPLSRPTEEQQAQARRFTQLLKEYRERLGISQSRLGILANCDHSYINRLEAGGRLPTAEMIDQLASALKLTPEERYGLLVAVGCSPDSYEVMTHPSVVAIIQSVSKLLAPQLVDPS